MKHIDYSLYLCTDEQLMTTDTVEESVELAIQGGASVVQVREKSSSAHAFYDTALRVKAVADAYDVPLIINDRVDIALALGAGVHVGQDDLPAAVVRQLIGPDRLLGVSASSVEQAEQAVRDGADYLGVGAMNFTATKTDATSVSMDELKRIRRAVDIPIVVIGGINQSNAALFRPLGIDGLAVISAIVAQPDIKRAAQEMLTLFQGGE